MPTPPPHDDFDGITLKGYNELTGPQELQVCWSCQKLFPVGRLVCLGGECALPVCKHCWDQMPVAGSLKQPKCFRLIAGDLDRTQISASKSKFHAVVI